MVPIHGAVVVTRPNRNSNSTVMVVAMITDADAASFDPNGDPCSVRDRRKCSECQAERCKGSE